MRPTITILFEMENTVRAALVNCSSDLHYYLLTLPAFSVLSRVTSLSVDYVLTLVLAVVLAVKYIVFDHDDDLQSQDVEVTMATASAAGVGEETSPPNEMTNSISAGQFQQFDNSVDEVLHNESTDDITPIPSSLIGMLVIFAANMLKNCTKTAVSELFAQSDTILFKDDRQRFLQKVSKKQFRTVYYNANACG